jgi:hypothetical protein
MSLCFSRLAGPGPPASNNARCVPDSGKISILRQNPLDMDDLAQILIKNQSKSPRNRNFFVVLEWICGPGDE